MHYKKIVEHYESCFEKHGDNHLGVDWPNESDLKKRFTVMLDVILKEDKETRLLDFGCGTALLKDFMIERGYDTIDYNGLDISQKFVDYSKKKFPKSNFYCIDILKQSDELPKFDYCVLNGVFTEKRELSFDEMLAYFKMMIKKIFEHTNKGVAFNVMSKNVDWERDDLFHLSLDVLSAFLSEEVSRHFVIRNDYGLYEYTVYVYKEPAQ